MAERSLPFDVLEDIISRLHTDFEWDDDPGKLDILAASLVCRSWNVAALPHVFRLMTFEFEDHGGLTRPSRESSSSLQAFHDFIKSNPAIGAFVRGLVLIRRLSEEHEDERYRIPLPISDVEETFDGGNVVAILEALPQIQRLKLSGIGFSHVPRHINQKFSLKTLEVCGVEDDIQSWGRNLQNILYVLSIFQDIGTLRLDRLLIPLQEGVRDNARQFIPLPATVSSFLDRTVAENSFYRILQFVDTTNLRSIYLPSSFLERTSDSWQDQGLTALELIAAQLINLGCEIDESTGTFMMNPADTKN